MWESRSVFCGGFSKPLVEIIKKKPPQATFVDFHSGGIFHSPRARRCFRLANEGDRYSEWEKFVESSEPNSNVN